MAIPKGIRTRDTPDWFADHLCIAGFANSDNPGTQAFKYISLLNDSTAGYYLAVYGFQVTVNIDPLADLFWSRETIGANVRAGSRINPTIGAPPGQIFYVNNGGSALLSNPFASIGGFVPSGAGGNWPMFVIPPNWSLVACPQIGDDKFGMTLFYVPMVDVKCTVAA